MKKYGYTLIAGLLLISTLAFAQRPVVFDGKYWQDQPLPGWETEVHDRIELMANVTWTALAPIPKVWRGDMNATFGTGETWKGIPYSGVHRNCGYVGKDISFYTFLSAVNNRRSSIYSVNYHLPPYNRKKGGSIYGSVCSATANYVTGIPVMMFCRYIRRGETGLWEDIGNDADSLQLYDTACYSDYVSVGHIVVICGIGRDENGRVCQVTTFEETGPINRMRTFSREDFVARTVGKYDAHFFRYDHEKWDKLIQLPPYIEQKPGFEYSFNTDLCPEDGERLSYPQGRLIRIDILTGKYRKLEVWRDGALHSVHPLSGDVVELTNLPEGLYTARLVKGKNHSSPIEFQVAQKACRAWYEDGRLYIGGCRDGVYPIGAYVAPKGSKTDSNYVISRACIKEGEDKWRVEPNIGQGTAKTLKVNLAAKYSGYWAETIQL